MGDNYKVMLAYCRFHLAFMPKMQWHVIGTKGQSIDDVMVLLRENLARAAATLEAALAVFPPAVPSLSLPEAVSIYYGWKGAEDALGEVELLQHLVEYWPAPSPAEVEGATKLAMHRLLHSMPPEKELEARYEAANKSV